MIASVLVALPLLAAIIVRISGFFPLNIATDSMAPLIPGDTAIMFHDKKSAIKNGDIVLVNLPLHKTPLFCRITAVEGQVIAIVDRKVLVNNQPIADKFFYDDSFVLPGNVARADNLPATRITLDYFFCLNHNWSNYYDSRTFGVFHKSQITARAMFRGFFKKI